MNEIVIKVGVVVELSAATREFLTTLVNARSEAPVSAPAKIEEPKPESAPVKPVKPSRVDDMFDEPELTQEAPPAQKQDSQPEPETKEEKFPTLEEARAAANDIIKNHRVEIVERLKEMGAKNITSLPKERRLEFIKFCKMIKGIDDAEDEC
jgi:hypothetical protein